MDFRLSEDQEALRVGIREFAEARFADERLAALEATGGFDAELWGALAEMGVFSLRRPEAEGGVGLGSAEAVLVFAELGRRLAPGPLLMTHLAAGRVSGAAAGETVVTGIVARDEAPPLLVPHLDAADALLVLRDAGVFVVACEALEAEPVAVPLDPLTPLHRLRRLPAGERVDDAAAAARLRLEGTALAAAALLGIAEGAQERATAYAGEREQFGRPIGSFQAVKHLLADAWARQEVARAAVWAAGAMLDDPGAGDLERTVSGALVVAADAAHANTATAIQVHGGMGYTWEVPVHLYWKRAHVCEQAFGASGFHAGRVAERLAAG